MALPAQLVYTILITSNMFLVLSKFKLSLYFLINTCLKIATSRSCCTSRNFFPYLPLLHACPSSAKDPLNYIFLSGLHQKHSRRFFLRRRFFLSLVKNRNYYTCLVTDFEWHGLVQHELHYKCCPFVSDNILLLQ